MKRIQQIAMAGFLLGASLSAFAGGYGSFRVAVYARAYEVKEMVNRKKLDSLWTVISQQVKVDKIYLETHRDKIMVDDSTIESAKKYFTAKGLAVAGGITYTMDEGNRYQTFCYSNPDQRARAKEIAEFTARHFDEIILDDFFFTNCKCDLCIKAKGGESWTQYRLGLMRQAAEELVIQPAKAANPNVKVVIKYPNWYEHFQALGFDLDREPKLFDGIYTGTETRDPVRTAQHLQQYESYLVFRYLENIKPGGNGGGWVDPGAMYYMDRYAEQLWLTLFAKAPEVTLFDFRQLVRPIRETDRAPWQSEKPSFDFDAMMNSSGTVGPATIARAAGYAFQSAGEFVDKLGAPVGVKSYKPVNSAGEDFLQNFLGMIGIPMELVPQFPTEANMILLTESAGNDPGLVAKIKGQLQAGKNVMITSGLLKALRGKGIEEIAELEVLGRKALVRDFNVGRNGLASSAKEILIPQIHYFTNDSWEDISALDSTVGWPFLHQAGYANGSLFVLTIPDDFADLYRLPVDVLNRVRQVLSQDVHVRLAGGAQVALFVYDNNTVIVESFLPEDVRVNLLIGGNLGAVEDILSGEKLPGQRGQEARVFGRASGEVSSFTVSLKPHSYRVFRYE